MFGRRDYDRASGRSVRNASVPSSGTERRPVDIIAQQMAVARLARLSGDWQAYEHARDNALRLVLTHRIEDEVNRFRQVMIACTALQYWGDEARELILKRLSDAFLEGVERGQSAHDLIVRMQRIPRGGATASLASEMRRGDGEVCIAFLLSKDGHVADDVRATFGDDPAQIAARMTARDWANFAMPLLTISPGEPRDEVMAAARHSLRRTLSEVASR